MTTQVDQRHYATGRRKTATARVWISPGVGDVTVNKKSAGEYFKRVTGETIVRQPLDLVKLTDKIDIVCTVRGGGLSAQAGAIRHGISKALVGFDPTLRRPIKKAGFLTRDSRVKERKKPGQPGARKRFQFSKR